jgi:hypothetical protein
MPRKPRGSAIPQVPKGPPPGKAPNPAPRAGGRAPVSPAVLRNRYGAARAAKGK